MVTQATELKQTNEKTRTHSSQLIDCVRCGGSVSTKALRCVHCGEVNFQGVTCVECSKRFQHADALRNKSAASHYGIRPSVFRCDPCLMKNFILPHDLVCGDCGGVIMAKGETGPTVEIPMELRTCGKCGSPKVIQNHIRKTLDVFGGPLRCRGCTLYIYRFQHCFRVSPLGKTNYSDFHSFCCEQSFARRQLGFPTFNRWISKFYLFLHNCPVIT